MNLTGLVSVFSLVCSYPWPLTEFLGLPTMATETKSNYQRNLNILYALRPHWRRRTNFQPKFQLSPQSHNFFFFFAFPTSERTLAEELKDFQYRHRRRKCNYFDYLTLYSPTPPTYRLRVPTYFIFVCTLGVSVVFWIHNFDRRRFNCNYPINSTDIGTLSHSFTSLSLKIPTTTSLSLFTSRIILKLINSENW